MRWGGQRNKEMLEVFQRVAMPMVAHIIGTTVNIPNITMVICAVISWVTAGKLWTLCNSFIKHTSCEFPPRIVT